MTRSSRDTAAFALALGPGMASGFGFFRYGQLYMKAEGALTFGTANTSGFRSSNGVQLTRDGGINVMMFHGGLPLGYRIPHGDSSF